jgi:hypothetical protein
LLDILKETALTNDTENHVRNSLFEIINYVSNQQLDKTINPMTYVSGSSSSIRSSNLTYNSSGVVKPTHPNSSFVRKLAKSKNVSESSGTDETEDSSESDSDDSEINDSQIHNVVHQAVPPQPGYVSLPSAAAPSRSRIIGYSNNTAFNSSFVEKDNGLRTSPTNSGPSNTDEGGYRSPSSEYFLSAKPLLSTGVHNQHTSSNHGEGGFSGSPSSEYFLSAKPSGIPSSSIIDTVQTSAGSSEGSVSEESS